jgi:hypothetical protein
MLAIRVAYTPMYPDGKGQGGRLTPGFGEEPSHLMWMLIMPSQGNACNGCDVGFPLCRPRSISLHPLILHAIVWPAQHTRCYHDASPSPSDRRT